MTELPDDRASGVDIPETDDPVVLRELLRQAREHLRLRESIERMMAESVARTEALLLEARAGQRLDPAAVGTAVAEARASLVAATAAIDRLAALVPARGQDPAAPASPETSPPAPPMPAPAPAGPVTTDVLVHEIHSPALARSLQEHLQGLDGVTRAEVRELAEGMLRITVERTGPLDAVTLAGWEPQRRRAVRTARPDVLEIELTPAD